MKRLADLTKLELASLSDQEVKGLIDLECAHTGIPLLPDVPVAPPKAGLMPDLAMYQIDDMYFLSPEDANKVAALVVTMDRVEPHYIPGPGYEQYAKPILKGTYPEIDTKRVYSAATASAQGSALVQQKASKDEYDEAKKEYDDVVEKRGDVANGVHEAIRAARREYARRNFLMTQYRRYLALAGGNSEIALGFLCDAYKDVGDYDGLFAALAAIATEYDEAKKESEGWAGGLLKAEEV